MDVDDCYSKVVGSFGTYQIIIYLILSIYGICLPSIALVVVFIGAKPNELQPDNPRVKNDSSILIEWDLMDSTWISDLIQSLFFGGFLIGVLVFGQLSDKFGRRLAMIAGYLALLPVCFVTSLSTSWQMFATCRFLNGMIGGGVTLVQFVYLQEIVGRSWWAITGAIQNAFFSIGILLLVFLAFYVPGWRDLIRIISCLQILPLICLMFIPESPRWLYSKGELAKAESVLLLIGRRNGVANPVCSLKKKPVEKPKQTYSMLDLFKHKVTAKRSAIMSYIWFVNSLVYYALTLAAGDIGNNTYTSESLSGIIEIPSALLCAMILNRIWCGRKKGIFYSMLLSGVACLLLMVLSSVVTRSDTTFSNATQNTTKSHSNDKSTATLMIGLCGKLAITFSFSSIYIYAPELFPTCVRNVALGSLSMFARVGGILASFSKSLIFSHPIAGYFLYGSAAITASILTCLLPETLGTKPPDAFDDLNKQLISQSNKCLPLRLSRSQSKVNKEEQTELLIPNEEDDAL